MDYSNLSKSEMAIAQAIIKHTTKSLGEKPYTGSKTFYGVEEWDDRGEIYGLSSELIVVHEEGDLNLFFNYDSMTYEFIESMTECLRELGYYAESCTGWYTAIYKL